MTPRPLLLYVSGSRLPTEKANGLQVVQMCGAFAAAGADVELWHPWRWQRDRRLRDADVFEFYGAEPTFRLRRVPNADVVALEGVLPGTAVAAANVVRRLAWGRLVAGRAARRRPDLLYTRDEATAYWSCRLGLPTALEMHLPPARLSTRLLRRVAGSPELLLLAGITRHIVDAWVGVGVPAGKTLVAPDAVDPARFAAVPTREEARRALGLDPAVPLVGYVGRFTAMGGHKGIETLVTAMGRVVADHPAARLACVGGPLDDAGGYRAAAARAGFPPEQLLLVDHVRHTEVPTWLGALDVATLPSPDTPFFRHASSPLKLFEYLAAGRAVVASALPAIEEIVEDGVTAVLVRPDDPAELGASISKLLADDRLRAEVGERARRASSRYTWQARARAILDRSGVATAAGRP